jgi:SAM-dependent methyltransferase
VTLTHQEDYVGCGVVLPLVRGGPCATGLPGGDSGLQSGDMDEKSIQRFWAAHPCGDGQVGGLDERYRGDYETFFRDYDAHRYRYEAHLPAVFDGLGVTGRRVLEIGLGEGADSEQLIRRGARWSGVDLTAESVDRVRTRLGLRGLPYERLEQASVTDLPFERRQFDLVFSHGVLHHVPDIGRAQQEIHRVLTPGGELVVMLYARWSLNYVLSISVLRRAALAVAYPAVARGWVRPGGLLERHVANASARGLLTYLRMREFLHRNTDGPDNPYSRVYGLREVRRDFPCFEVTRTYKRFMHAPPLPVHGLPGGRLVGWHLWVHLRPR